MSGRHKRQFLRGGPRDFGQQSARAGSPPPANSRSGRPPRMYSGSLKHARRRPRRFPPTPCGRLRPGGAPPAASAPPGGRMARARGSRRCSCGFTAPRACTTSSSCARMACSRSDITLRMARMKTEPEGVICSQAWPQPRPVERQGVDLFERPRLELLAVVAGHRRPAEHLAGVQRRNPHRPPGGNHFQRDISRDQQIKQAGMVALVENQFAGGETALHWPWRPGARHVPARNEQ